MRIRIVLAFALAAIALSSCCPGSMLGDGGVAPMRAHPARITPKSADSDGDGVADALDRCPHTPAGAAVNRDGCSDAQLAALTPPAPPPHAVPAPTPPTETPAPPPPTPAPSRSERELTTHGQILLENVYFESGSSRLTPESNASLDEAGEAVSKYPALMLEVSGYTDSRGAADFNLRLSQARSRVVRAYLVTHFPLDGSRIRARGYGETQAGAAGGGPEGLKQDRRVVLRVLNPEVLPKNVDIKR